MNTIMTYNHPKHRGTGLYHLLRGLFLALLLIAGSAKEAWGQTSGLYYIANNNDKNPYYSSLTPSTNYYLVPASDGGEENININTWAWNDDSATPFVTTYKTNQDNNSIWLVKESATSGEYYLIHVLTGKYMTLNAGVGSNSNRRTFHLETTSTPGDAHLFNFTFNTTYYNIKPKTLSSGHRFVNPSKANQDKYYGTTAESSYAVGGLIGTYNSDSDNGSKWYLEPASVLLAPTISDYDASTGKVTVTENNSLPAGYKIRYTFSAEGMPADPNASSSFITNSAGNPNEITISGPGTLKAVIERYGVVLTEVSAPKTITKVATPTFSYDGSAITIQCATGGATIYYATSTDGGSTYGGYTAYDDTPLTGLSIGTYIKAKATKSGLINSDESEYILRPECVFGESEGNITLSCSTNPSEIRYTTNGEDPSGVGVTYSIYPPATPLSASGQHLIKAYAVVNDGVNTVSSAVVTLFNKPDVTLSQDTYTYDGTAHEPTVTKVAITRETEYEAPTTPTPTYVIDSYADNTDAGTATVTLGDNDESDGIFFAHITKEFTINPASLTINVDAGQTKVYGDDEPVLTYSKTGIVEGDDWADVLSGTLARDIGEDVGDYAITQGTLTSNTNYTIDTFTPEDFSITAKSVGDGDDPATGITFDITKDSGSTYTVTVRNNGSEMTVGTSGTDYDYSLTTTGNAESKYFEFEVTGANNYKDSFKCKFANVRFGKLAGSIAPGGAATFVSNSGDNDFATPADMTAYIITGVNTAAGTVTAEALDYIPEGVPVLLMSTVNANGFIVQPRDGGTTITTEQEAANMLKEATSAMLLTTAQYYLLYNCEFVLNAAGTLPAGWIYLDTSGGGGGGSGAPARLTIIWDSETGIEDISRFTTFKEYYSLDGRRVGGTPVKSGLYIRDGKKVVVIRK